MIYYIIIFCFIFSAALLDIFVNSKLMKLVLFSFVSILLFVLIGFRQTGYDYESYFGIFENIKGGLDVLNVEPGFIYICMIPDSFRGLLLFVAFLTLFLHLSYIYKYSSLPLLSILILSTTFLYPTFMGQMRQGLAMGIVVWALFFLDKNKFYFLLIVVLATCIHFSAIIALIFLLQPNYVKSIKYYLIVFSIAIIASLIIEPFVSRILNMLPFGAAVDKLLFYSETEDYKLGLNSAIVIRLIIFSLAYSYRNRIQNPQFPLLLNIYFYSIVLYLALGFIPQLGGRGTLYFAYFDIILVPMIISSSTKYHRLMIVLVILLLSFLRFLTFFASDFNFEQYVPYFKGELNI